MATHKPKNNYKRGTEIEHKIKNMLEVKGWFVVRSAGSKGVLDLIAMNKKGEIFCIQAKRTKAKNIPWGKYSDEIKALEKFTEEYNNPKLRVEFWVWKDRQGWTVHSIKQVDGQITYMD